MSEPAKVEMMPWSVPAWMQTMPDPADLVETDGEPLDSNWHRLAMNLLIASVDYYLRDRKDFFCGGNMFIYYSAEQAKNKDYRGPDFFFVWGVDRNKQRDYWAIWYENYKFPNVIIELLSSSTARTDRTTKKDIYEKIFKTPEYFLYDPDNHSLEGFRLNSQGQYEPITANDKGWLWCNELQLWLGNWNGNYSETPGIYPRFFEPNGNLVLIGDEAEKLRADAEKQRADTEKQRADTEKQRAEAAEAELAQLKAKLVELEAKNKPTEQG